MIYKPTHEEAAAVEALHAAGQIQYMEAAQELLSSHAEILAEAPDRPLSRLDDKALEDIHLLLRTLYRQAVAAEKKLTTI